MIRRELMVALVEATPGGQRPVVLAVGKGLWEIEKVEDNEGAVVLVAGAPVAKEPKP